MLEKVHGNWLNLISQWRSNEDSVLPMKTGTKTHSFVEKSMYTGNTGILGWKSNFAIFGRIHKYIYSQCSPEFCPHIICPSGKSKKSVWHRVAVVTGIPNPIRPPLALNSNDSVSSLGPIFVRPFQIRRKRSSNNNNFKTYFWRAFAHFGTLCVYNSTVDKNTFKRASFSKYLNFCT